MLLEEPVHENNIQALFFKATFLFYTREYLRPFMLPETKI